MSVLLDFKGGVAFVTGGVSGLGLATSRRFLKEGINVFAVDLNEEKGQAFLEAAAKEFPSAKADFAVVDVTNEAAVEEAFNKAGKLGPLRIVVNCAGMAMPGRTLSPNNKPLGLAQFNKVLSINLIGTFNVSRIGASRIASSKPVSAEGDKGVIVNVASVAAFEGQIGQVAYSAAKAGVVGMTLPMARDLARVGIRVCTIAPGIIDTPMFGAAPQEMKNGLASEVVFPQRLGNPEEFANLAYTIVQTAYLNGETIRIDGGIRMQPKSKV
jgi:NAD(P)-dependent dehydrogenase (short-subunit alcohol dehydrogenase family)